MGNNILLISEDENIITRYRGLFKDKPYTFNSCCTETSIFDLIEIEPQDIIIIDENVEIFNLPLLLKKIKPN